MSDDVNGEGIHFAGVPIEIKVVVGKARPSVQDLLNLSPSDVLPLDRKIDAPVELYVGDRLIAVGELEEVVEDTEEFLAVRLTKIHGGTNDG